MNPPVPIFSTLSGSTRAALVFGSALAGAVLIYPVTMFLWLLMTASTDLGAPVFIAGASMPFALVAKMARRRFDDAQTMSVWGFAFATTGGFFGGGYISLFLSPSVVTVTAAAIGAGAGAALGSFLGSSPKGTAIGFVILLVCVGLLASVG